MLRSILLAIAFPLALSGCGGDDRYAPVGMTQQQIDQVNYPCNSQTAALIGADTSNFLIALEMKKQCYKANGFTNGRAAGTAPAPGFALNLFA